MIPDPLQYLFQRLGMEEMYNFVPLIVLLYEIAKKLHAASSLGNTGFHSIDDLEGQYEW